MSYAERSFCLMLLVGFAAILGTSPNAAAQVRVAVEDGSNNGTGADIVTQLNNSPHGNFSASQVIASDIDTPSELSQYDVVIVGNSGSSNDHDWTATMWSALRSWVDAGGAVIAVGWFNYAVLSTTPGATDIEYLIPLENVAPYSFEGSSYVLNFSVGQSHPITNGLSNFAPGANNVEVNAHTPESNDTVLAATTASSVNKTIAVKQSIGPGGGRSVYLGVIYMANASYNSAALRTGAADQLLAQAVLWAGGPRPTIANLAPDPVDWLQTLTINGTNIDNATEVTIGGVSQTILSNTATDIEVTVSDTTPAGSQPVVVKRNGPSSSPVNVVVNAVAPIVTSATPDPVHWLQPLTIDGNALAGASSVTIGGVAQTITTATSTSVGVLVSDATPLGLQTVEVTTPGGTTSSLSVTVDGSPPAISTALPIMVSWFDTLTLTGTALANATTVTVAGVEATILSNTAHEIQIEVPVTTVGGAVNVEVTTAFGSDTTGVTLTGQAPLVSGITPSSIFSVESFTVTGANFTGVYLVEIGGVEAIIQSASATELVVMPGPLTRLGEQVVTVTNAFGSDANHSILMRIKVGSSGCGALPAGPHVGFLPLALLVVLFALFAIRRRLAA